MPHSGNTKNFPRFTVFNNYEEGSFEVEINGRSRTFFNQIKLINSLERAAKDMNAKGYIITYFYHDGNKYTEGDKDKVDPNKTAIIYCDRSTGKCRANEVPGRDFGSFDDINKALKKHFKSDFFTLLLIHDGEEIITRFN